MMDLTDDTLPSPTNSPPTTPPTTPTTKSTTPSKLTSVQKNWLLVLVKQLKQVEVPPYSNPLKHAEDIWNDEDCVEIIEQADLEVIFFLVACFFYCDFLQRFFLYFWVPGSLRWLGIGRE